MELQMDSQSLHERRPHLTKKPRRVRWVKEWVSQDLASTGGKCLVLKWVREDVLKVLKERWNESVSEEREPEATSEVLFLCSFEGCGKTFIDAGALRKHSHVHGERQYACQYEGCGKKFLDSSKLKRHHLIHTGQRDYACPYEGCGKAFSLDFNLRAHMRTHTQENYHNCPYQDCGKRFAHDYKLQAHIRSYHEKGKKDNIKHEGKDDKNASQDVMGPESSGVVRRAESSHTIASRYALQKGKGKSLGTSQCQRLSYEISSLNEEMKTRENEKEKRRVEDDKERKKALEELRNLRAQMASLLGLMSRCSNHLMISSVPPKLDGDGRGGTSTRKGQDIMDPDH